MGAQFLLGEDGFDADIAALPAGGYVATWQVGSQLIYARRLDSNGGLTGGPTLVENFGGGVFDPQAEGLSDGRSVITWGGFTNGNEGTLFSRLFDQAGDAAAAPTPIATGVKKYKGEPALSTAPLGDGYAAAWQVYPGVELHAMALNGDGSVAADFGIGGTIGIFYILMAVASLASSDPTFVVASFRTTGAGASTIVAQRFKADGTPLGSELTVADVLAGGTSGIEVAALPDGGFVVIWESYKNAANGGDIHLQRFDQNGNKVGVETKVNTHTPGNQLDPAIALLPDDGFVVAWESQGQDGDGLGVYAQRFNADGTPNGVEFQVSTTTQGDQHAPAVAASGGGYTILWTMEDGVYGRTFKVLNAPPAVPATASLSIVEDTPSAPVAIGASDPDGDELAYAVKPGSLPQKGSVTFTGDSFTYTPDENATGADEFTLLVTDAGGLAAEQTVSVSIAPVNDAPTGLTLASAKVKELSAVGATVGPLAAADVDGDPLTYTLVDDAGGRFSLYNYTLLVRYGVGLDYEQHKTHTVTVRATDPGGLSVETSFVIEVLNVTAERTKGSAVADLIVGGGGRDQLAGGRQNDTIYGGGGGDTLRGGSGQDRVDGGAGKDVLYGNTGKDAFLFTARLGRSNVDTLRDFQLDDAIWLENALFKGIGSGSLKAPKVMRADAFQLGAVAQDAEDRILYDPASGAVYYDPDGSGAAAAVRFAVVATKKALTVQDFLVI